MKNSQTIYLLWQPSALPTKVVYPNDLWSQLVSAGIEPQIMDLNYAWWEGLGDLLDSALGVERFAEIWGEQLSKLQHESTYRSIDTYHAAVQTLASALCEFNNSRTDISILLSEGLRSHQIDNESVEQLVGYSRSETIAKTYLRYLVSISDIPPGSAFLVSVQNSTDLFSAAMTARVIGECVPDAYVCLFSHGHENFSMKTFLEKYDCSALFECFSSVVLEHDDRAIEAVSAVQYRRMGLLRRMPAENSSKPITLGRKNSAPYPFPMRSSFSASSVLMTRVSPKRCYWSRCTYCTQNEKYLSERAPSKSDVADFLLTMSALVVEGYRFFLFSDEALSPSILRELASGIIAAGFNVVWACRSKLELAFDDGLVKLLKKSGCCEILFGLETMDAEVQKRMGKFDPRLTENAVQEIFAAFGRFGISMHVNLIAGFPGDDEVKVRTTVEFVKRNAVKLPAPTTILNRFVVFDGTPIASRPSDFSIELLTHPGNLPAELPFKYQDDDDPAKSALACVDELTTILETIEDWSHLYSSPAGNLTAHMVARGAHGIFFKARATGLIA